MNRNAAAVVQYVLVDNREVHLPVNWYGKHHFFVADGRVEGFLRGGIGCRSSKYFGQATLFAKRRFWFSV